MIRLLMAMVKYAYRTTLLIALFGTALGIGTALSQTSPRSLKPSGLPGKWRLVFDDEFNGMSLNRRLWNPHAGWTNQNHVTDHVRNIAVRDGHLTLTLASPTSGAEIGTRSFGLQVGEYAVARIEFAGRGSTVYNWPAWWVSGPQWPAGGENDIAEGFGRLTVNYHAPSVNRATGPVHGSWAGAFHTYGLYRGPNYAAVYWDGRLVRRYPTADDGQPQKLLLTLGSGNVIRTGPAGAMVVDYVRVWAPAGH